MSPIMQYTLYKQRKNSSLLELDKRIILIEITVLVYVLIMVSMVSRRANQAH